jgi:chromosome segregation ATPase
VTFSEPGKKGQLTTQPGEFLLRSERTGRRWSMKFWLYATSEQEARETAELFIRYAKSLADIRLRRAEDDLEDYRKRITDIENEIPKLEEERKPLEAELAKVKETTYFRNKDDAQRSILEWNNLLSAAEVDIIGIQAKLDMVKELRKKEQEKVEADELFWFLFRMRMAEEIELAGALARKNAALAYRDKALKFLDLAEKLESLEDELNGQQMTLSSDKRDVAKMESRLPQLRADVRPVEVVDNEVTIHPVVTQTPKPPRSQKKSRQ